MNYSSVTLIVILIDILCVFSLTTGNCVYDLTPNLTVHIEKFLVKNDSYIDIETGSELLLICNGTEQIVWVAENGNGQNNQITDEYLEDYISPPTNINIEPKEDPDNKLYISKLTISEITVSEVGYYSCYYKSRCRCNTPFSFTDAINLNGTNSIYVFVTDKNNLFAHPDNLHLDRQNKLAVNNSVAQEICRPSSSLATVSLHNSHPVSIENQMIISSENGIRFDSRHGFRIEHVQNDRFWCEAKLGNHTQVITLSIQFYNGLNYDPVIDDFGKQFIFVGDNFTLGCTCKVNTRSQYLAHWNTERICSKDLDNRKFEFSDESNKNRNISRNITIINAQLSDQGLYECQISDVSNNKRIATKLINIYKGPKLELKIVDLTDPLTLDQDEDFQLNISIEAVPNVTSALSEKLLFNGNMIMNYNNRIKLNKHCGYTQIVINEVQCEDTGLYLFEANLLNEMLVKNISFNLMINGCKQNNTIIIHNNTIVIQNKTIFHNSTNFPIGPRPQKSDSGEVIIIVIFVIFGATLLAMAVFIGKKIREARIQKRELALLNMSLLENGQLEINPDLPLDEQVDLLSYDMRFEFPRENLTFGPILGQGAFGRVIRAKAIGIENLYKSDNSLESVSTTVAIKMLKENADLSQRRALLTELKILIHVGKHLNIVNLLGAVTENLIKGELLVIVEYCKFGNMRTYLMDNRNNFVNQLDENNDLIDPELGENEPKYQNINQSFTNEYQNIASIAEINQSRGRIVKTCDLINYVFQCSKGMDYLSSKKLIHRDLAARNVLLADNDIVKICDFGLARDCYNYDNYVKKGDGPLPIKWMAIESMRDKLYTEKSDVWSFGVLLWEIFTLGSNPYPGLDLDEEFYKKLINGYRMDRPNFAPNIIYTLMKKCWSQEPDDRPDFKTISDEMRSLMAPKIIEKYKKHLQNYNTTTCANETPVGCSKIDDSAESYVDMTIKRGKDIRVEYHANKSQYSDVQVYDDPQNVRSIFPDTPLPKEPIEAVPLIQL